MSRSMGTVAPYFADGAPSPPKTSGSTATWYHTRRRTRARVNASAFQ